MASVDPVEARTTKSSDDTDVVVGSREQLLHLLAEASEIEHTLMCSYLYAAFSLKRGGEAGLSAAEANAVDRWRETIMGVAIEEMGHLLIVANLTVAVGGRPHFGRPNFPVSPGYFPSGVVVRLSPFSLDTLEHFIFLERPEDSKKEDNEAFDQPDYARDQAYRGLMPGAQDYATIGHLYEAVRINLAALVARLGEAGVFVGPAKKQLAGDFLGASNFGPIETLESALAAIELIVEEGEGARTDREKSHYHSFIGVRGEYRQLLEANPAFAAAWPAADSPVLRRPPEPDDKAYIDALPAAAMLDFGCAVYGLLLRLLGQCFGREESGPVPQQERLFSAAVQLMHVLGDVSAALVQLPASKSAPGVNAGMTFTMLRGPEPLVSGPSELALLREQLGDLARAAESLRLKAAHDLGGLAEGFAL